MSGLHVVVGLGASGYSVVRYLTQQNISVAVTDSRCNPPNLNELIQHFPKVKVSLGKLDETLLAQAERIVISPGVSLKEPAIAHQILRGISVVGDIELFAQAAKAPIIAITGTNAKSTVTTLVGEMVKMAGLTAKVGGNLGLPALALLEEPEPDVFVLELSSFQLETTYSLEPKVATVLNITPDHMDRYAQLEEYRDAKHRVYAGAEVAVCNKDDLMTECVDPFVKNKLYFSLSAPGENEFGLFAKAGETYLALGDHLLMPTRELPIVGRHYQANALASLAIGYGFGLSLEGMLETLRKFKGLPHRCQLVRQRNKVCWYNDSKGTNVGATLAAIEGLGPEIKGKLILIAGGVGKNADFSPLVSALEKYVKNVILIGEAAPILAAAIGNKVTVSFADTLENAVNLADLSASADDSILLSPACASFDMFKNFEHRGDVYTHLVNAL